MCKEKRKYFRSKKAFKRGQRIKHSKPFLKEKELFDYIFFGI